MCVYLENNPTVFETKQLMLFYVAFSENFEEHVAQHQGLMTTYLNAIVNTLQGRKISAILEKLHFSKSGLYENF